MREEIEEKAGTHLIPVVVTPEGEYLWDTTPIAFYLDERYPEGQMLPETPVQRIVARLLEDYFDEWVTRIVIHFRWFNEDDTETSGRAMVREMLGISAGGESLSEDESAKIDEMLAGLIAWGRGTCERVGSAKADTEAVHEEYGRLLTCLEAHFRENDFFLGARPSLGDFTLWGGMEAHFYFDPTPRLIMDGVAPSLRNFHQRLSLAKCSDVPDWPVDDAIPETLTPLLQLIGETFCRFLVPNRAALAAGQKTLAFDLWPKAGKGPQTLMARKYTDKCRAEIAAEVAALSAGDRAKVEAVLAPVGCWAAYAA